MLAMERTHRLRADLAWVPSHARRTSRLIRGATWAAVGAGAVGSIALAPIAAPILWKGFVLGGAGAIAIADRAARASLRAQLAKMTRGELALAELDQREEGELVVVRGTVEADEALRGVLIDAEGVYRRMIFRARGTWVHEAAVDFTLVDARGARIRIEAGGARWMTPHKELVEYPSSRFAGAELSSKVKQLAAGKDSIEAIERVLPVGAAVQIVGYKTTSADATGVAREYREAPQRATLRSGTELPLVISRSDEPL
ncbi:MAG: hypothetical protein M4D80_38520 [Myxococcota bacterium]|nr:hypothetical protein [Myxococcota bacterium]